ncbi:hypothetical protein CMUST_09115 [Corynebacterium mustelae]|uniref:N-acetyltransferase domain-containing protein n=2 Tax=Corynebacterium mustelae TaxID=571915 RepID=A0A0G3H070_9CORY|nr:hypothetical protein CMUST_09115 [Corynebacterium mustelae]
MMFFMTAFFQFEQPPLRLKKFDPSEALLSFIFSANLAAQDVSGDTATSTSAGAVIESLKENPQSATVILAAVSDSPTLAGCAISPLKYPIISAYQGSTAPSLFDANLLGFIEASVPLQAHTNGIDCDVILGAEIAPIPGQIGDETETEHWLTLLNQTKELVKRVNRKVVRLWHSVPLNADEMNPRFTQAVTKAGFSLVHDETHGYIPVATKRGTAVPLLPEGYSFYCFSDLKPAPEMVPGILALFDAANTDIPVGAIEVSPQPWTNERLEQAQATLRRKANEKITMVLLKDRLPIGFSDVTRLADSDPTVADQGHTLIDANYRGNGLGKLLKEAILITAANQWPELERVFTSTADSNAAMCRINNNLGFTPLNRTQVYQTEIIR